MTIAARCGVRVTGCGLRVARCGLRVAECGVSCSGCIFESIEFLFKTRNAQRVTRNPDNPKSRSIVLNLLAVIRLCPYIYS